MINTVTKYDFRQAFLSSDTYKNNFSYNGLTALFNYLDELDEETGHQTEFDLVAIACTYSELTLDEIRDSYEDAEDLDDDELIDWLEDRCQVIRIEGTTDLIISEF